MRGITLIVGIKLSRKIDFIALPRHQVRLPRFLLPMPPRCQIRNFYIRAISCFYIRPARRDRKLENARRLSSVAIFFAPRYPVGITAGEFLRESICLGSSLRTLANRSAMKLPIGDRADVGTKIEDDVLNPRHWDGRHKARVFESVLGITLGNREVFREAVLLIG